MVKSKFEIWLLASRPKTLWASISPVVIGTAMAYADGKFHWLSAVVALTATVLIQIGTNIANDYFDYKRGADAGERLGPLRVTQAGLVKPEAVKAAFIIVFSLAFLLGLYLIWRGGYPILIIGLLSLLFGILYTGGPFPLGYTGLADLFVLIFFGPIAVGGTYYVQALAIKPAVIIAGFSPGLLATAILTINNLRDIKTDRQAGKKTLAVRFGANFAKIEYFLCIFTACLIPIFLSIYSNDHYYSIVCLIILFVAIHPIKIVFSRVDGPALNAVLANTGKLLFLYSILFSVGWIL